MEIPYNKVKDGLVIEVKVVPGSSRAGIVGVFENVLRVKLTAPPVEGAANEQLIKLLSEEFGIKKSNVIIVKGGSSRRKTIKLKGVNL